jgi:hypothetical protein
MFICVTCLSWFLYKLLTQPKVTIKPQIEMTNLEQANKSDNSPTRTLMNYLEMATSFILTIDSKFIGLIIFLAGNLCTGFINTYIRYGYGSDVAPLFIVSIYTFIVLFIGFFAFYLMNAKRFS